MPLSERTGARILVDQLIRQGVERIFCVPGESYLAVLDALHGGPIQLITCRQEGGAAMMAEATGKLTGRPGICFVTRGPGATNAASGVHVARQDSTPMILFVGQVQRHARGREAFQEVDYRAVFGPLAKWATEIDDPARVPEIISRAFHVAMSGRPGPVVIALPEDMQTETATVADAAQAQVPETHPGEAEMAELGRLIGAAERPLMVLGGTRWTPAAVADVAAFAEHFALPVAVTFRRQTLFPASHPAYAGDLGVGANPRLVRRATEADLLLVAGSRMSETATQGYRLIGVPEPGRTLIHVHADPDELGRVYRPTLAINATPVPFAAALARLAAPPAPRFAAWRDAVRADYLAWNAPPAEPRHAFDLGVAIGLLREDLPEDAIVTNGAGNYAAFLGRHWRTSGFDTQYGPTSGSMGYGVPAAVAAKLRHPGRTVVAFAGDGCFMMTGQEFATAVQYDLPIVVVVVDNGMLGTIRMHQERHYPARVEGTDLRNPDFAAYARAFGGHGERVERTEDFLAAFRRAVASGKPAIVHCIADPEALSPTTTLSALRESSLAARAGQPSA